MILSSNALDGIDLENVGRLIGFWSFNRIIGEENTHLKIPISKITNKKYALSKLGFFSGCDEKNGGSKVL